MGGNSLCGPPERRFLKRGKRRATGSRPLVLGRFREPAGRGGVAVQLTTAQAGGGFDGCWVPTVNKSVEMKRGQTWRTEIRG